MERLTQGICELCLMVALGACVWALVEVLTLGCEFVCDICRILRK